MNKIVRTFCMLLVACALGTVATSCSDNDYDPTYLNEVKVSQSIVGLNADGGEATIEIDAAADWTIEDAPAWLTVTPASGSAGKTQVKLSAPATTESYDVVLKLVCGGKTQLINVVQQADKVDVPLSTCAEIIAGPESKTYRVTGMVKSIANTVYGNWYLQDETGEVYIYGTLDKSGNSGQNNSIAAWGIEVGDEITVEGPKTLYNTTVELVNVTVLNINKSLIKVDSLSTDEALPMEGGNVDVYISCKGATGVGLSMPMYDWLSVVGMDIVNGEAVLSLHAAPNQGGDRSMTVQFFTRDDAGKKYTTEATITQKGAIVEAPVADFLAAEVGSTQYRLTGIITGLYSSDSQGKSFYIRDYSGQTLVYRAEGFIEAGAKVGDVVTVVGQRGAYKDSPQMVSGTFEELKYSVTKVTIEEFLAKEDNPNVYYMVTGTVDEIANPAYGNLYIKDGDARLYTYGCYPGWGATGDARKDCVADEDITVGDVLTIIGPKSTYNGTPQMNGGLYFSHEKPE